MSRLLQKKWEERQYQAHQQKVNAMKSSVDNAPPKQHPHLVLRLKKVQKDEERQAQIDHTNALLLQKMTYIMRTKGRVDNWNDYETKSLNQQVREKEQEKIAEANVGIAKRIEAVRPTYDIHAWDEDAKKHEYYQDMWNTTTKDYQTPRYNHGAKSDEARRPPQHLPPLEKTSSSSKHPQSKQSLSQHPRSNKSGSGISGSGISGSGTASTQKSSNQ